MWKELRLPAAVVALATLTGCNAALVGALVTPLNAFRPSTPSSPKPVVFSLSPTKAAAAKTSARAPVSAARAPAAPTAVVQPPAAAPAAAPGAFGSAIAAPAPSVAPEAAPAAPAAEDGRLNIVKLVGRAQVSEKARGIANVRDGLVTGTPVNVVDAQTGHTIATAVSYYDGSFSVDVKFRSAASAVLLTTDLIDAADPTLKATISAPVLLRAADAQRIVSITPGSTALTSFLQAVATLQDAGDKAMDKDEVLPQDPMALAAVKGPRLGSLIAAMKDVEQASFAKVADSAPELSDAESVAGLRAGIMKFVGRLSVKKTQP